jgi:hypothetical protein
MMGEIFKELISQLLALVAFFAFPAIQYLLLKRFARNEGQPELWYLPKYGFRLVIRNIPGKRALSDLKYCARLRKIIPASEGSSVLTYEEDVLTREDDFFLFPGSDQLILSFRIGGESATNLEFLLTDKLGREMRRVPFANIDVLITDYTATLENLFNFNVKLAKRAAIKVASLRNIWLEVEKNNVEQQFAIDVVRIVG